MNDVSELVEASEFGVPVEQIEAVQIVIGDQSPPITTDRSDDNVVELILCEAMNGDVEKRTDRGHQQTHFQRKDALAEARGYSLVVLHARIFME
jgi:hypothetical protein